VAPSPREQAEPETEQQTRGRLRNLNLLDEAGEARRGVGVRLNATVKLIKSYAAHEYIRIGVTACCGRAPTKKHVAIDACSGARDPRARVQLWAISVFPKSG
jgi:hypothetical protein